MATSRSVRRRWSAWRPCWTSTWRALRPSLASVWGEASFAAACAGGLLALLAPCSALLLPAFFAYAFANRAALLKGSLLFLAGLCTVLLPLGLAASLVG